MNLIDGKKISADLRERLKNRVIEIKKKGIKPGLATILVGDDPGSKVYVSSKIKTCGELGIESFSYNLPKSAKEEEIINLIKRLNEDTKVSGILLQLPLPAGLNSNRCLEAISPKKDADGLHPYNLGLLLEAKSWKEVEEKGLMMPCTPSGIIYMLKIMKVEMEGKRAVVIGRSNLVGKPIAVMLMANNATVTMAHSRTKDLSSICKEADILVAAIGKAGIVTKDYVKEGAAVIDVGMNRVEGVLCGDVDFANVKDVAGCITPVPGGVGPMTITMLMNNTITASDRN